MSEKTRTELGDDPLKNAEIILASAREDDDISTLRAIITDAYNELQKVPMDYSVRDPS